MKKSILNLLLIATSLQFTPQERKQTHPKNMKLKLIP